jgi:hypothetical protein
MKKNLINLAYGAYLGGALTIVDLHWSDWKFYVILIPTLLLAEMKVYHTKDDE